MGKCKHNFVKEEGIMMLSGGITDLAEEELWRCTQCGEPDYRPTGKKLDLIESMKEDFGVEGDSNV